MRFLQYLCSLGLVRWLLKPLFLEISIRRIEGNGGTVLFAHEWDEVLDTPIAASPFFRSLVAVPILGQFFKTPNGLVISGHSVCQQMVSNIKLFTCCTKVKQLEISECDIEVKVLAEVLNYFKDLTYLCLNRTNVSDDVCEILCSFSGLNIVTMFDTNVTLKGVRCLEASNTKCRIGWDGVTDRLNWWKADKDKSHHEMCAKSTESE